MRRPAEGFAKVETHPATAQIVRFGHDFAMHDDARITDGYHVVFQIAIELHHVRDHFTRRQSGPGIDLSHVSAPRYAGLDMVAADVNNEHAPLGLSLHDLRTIAHLHLARQPILLT